MQKNSKLVLILTLVFHIKCIKIAYGNKKFSIHNLLK